MAYEERVTIAAPDHCVAQIEGGPTGRRYTARNGGLYDVHPADAKALLREGGFVPNLGGGADRPGGFVCDRCGRRNYFKACRKCADADAQGRVTRAE